MTHYVFLVSKFHETKKGVTIYFVQDSHIEIWTEKKMKAKIYNDEKNANDVAKKYKAFISTIPILL